MPKTTLPTDPIAETLAALWSPVLAITTHHQGRSNGLVAGTGVFASLVPEAPRVLIELTKASLTHDLVLASRVFALHLLPATPNDALVTSLSLVHTLGMRSGHDGDKMVGIAARPGVTGSPILAETLTYVEARVVATLDGEELITFLPTWWVVAATEAENRSRLVSFASTCRRNGLLSGQSAVNVKPTRQDGDEASDDTERARRRTTRSSGPLARVRSPRPLTGTVRQQR